MPQIEKNPIIENSDIIGKNPETALSALKNREDLVLAEAEKFWIGEIQCTEFSHRNEESVRDFFNSQFSNLADLVVPE